ncbi:hypothetical protein CAC42_4912 [Sphaceloma murrayae]|uniref:Succinate dehydrogenase assembly factor 4, mitochondrial n=1 Tax=Sphaceloma murrayae TaxID=2082308 RepID=A0A2K1QPB5_9PEZI|nr:hypothetical protein CAC42_4912 [Sphaceloma murrayae]
MSNLRTPRLLSMRGAHLYQRPFSSFAPRRAAFSPGPAPPRLPKEEQELFEKLQQQSMGAFSQPQDTDPSTAETSPADVETTAPRRSPIQVNQPGEQQNSGSVAAAPRVSNDGEGEELHPNIRRGAPPEFQGEKNPKTGEVGGPKNEPLRWGHGGDWSYNGRVTDF